MQRRTKMSKARKKLFQSRVVMSMLIFCCFFFFRVCFALSALECVCVRVNLVFISLCCSPSTPSFLLSLFLQRQKAKQENEKKGQSMLQLLSRCCSSFIHTHTLSPKKKDPSFFSLCVSKSFVSSIYKKDE